MRHKGVGDKRFPFSTTPLVYLRSEEPNTMSEQSRTDNSAKGDRYASQTQDVSGRRALPRRAARGADLMTWFVRILCISRSVKMQHRGNPPIAHSSPVTCQRKWCTKSEWPWIFRCRWATTNFGNRSNARLAAQSVRQSEGVRSLGLYRNANDSRLSPTPLTEKLA